MSIVSVPNEEFDAYAHYLGLTGVDADLFYECYYQLDNEDYEYQDVIDEHYEVYWWNQTY